MMEKKPFPRTTWEQLREQYIYDGQRHSLERDFLKKFYEIDVIATKEQKESLKQSLDRYLNMVLNLEVKS